MSGFVVNPNCSTPSKTFNTRGEAATAQDSHLALCEDCTDSEDAPIQPQNGDAAEVVENPDNAHDAVEVSPEEYEDELSADPSIEEDPVDWLPGHFIDSIQGVPTVNRKGYAVIASKYNVSVTAEPVTLASETGFEYAEFQAIATTESGEEYSGFGSAHVDRMDGDDQYLLNELAETRALKRATAWATGVGLTAVEELQGEL